MTSAAAIQDFSNSTYAYVKDSDMHKFVSGLDADELHNFYPYLESIKNDTGRNYPVALGLAENPYSNSPALIFAIERLRMTCKFAATSAYDAIKHPNLSTEYANLLVLSFYGKKELCFKTTQMDSNAVRALFSTGKLTNKTINVLLENYGSVYFKDQIALVSLCQSQRLSTQQLYTIFHKTKLVDDEFKHAFAKQTNLPQALITLYEVRFQEALVFDNNAPKVENKSITEAQALAYVKSLSGKDLIAFISKATASN